MITFVRTCYACPEQYDAFDGNGKQIGYLRLRHSQFTVECPDVGGELVYIENVGDDDTGIFSDEERATYLKKAAYAIGQHAGYSFVEYKVIDDWDMKEGEL